MFEGSLASLDSRSITSADSRAAASKNSPPPEDAAPKLLGSSVLKFTYFEAKGIEMGTTVTRIDGRRAVSLSGADGGFPVSPKDAVVRISRPDYNFYHDIYEKVDIVEVPQVKPLANKTSAKGAPVGAIAPPNRYTFSVRLPSLKAKVVEEAEEGDDETEAAEQQAAPVEQIEQLSLQEQAIHHHEDEEVIDNLPADPLTYVYISVFLNGVPGPLDAEEKLAKLILFDKVTISNVNTPKGGFPPGTPVLLTTEGLHVDLAAVVQTCVVRIRGHTAEGGFVVCEGHIDYEANTIEFPMPDLAAEAMEPEMRGKDKWYFVELSLDGGCSFDTQDEAVIHAK